MIVKYDGEMVFGLTNASILPFTDVISADKSILLASL